jgi:hypothetical protein
MANSYSWNCKTVDIYPTYESESDVVYNIHWRLIATSDQDDAEGNPYTASVYSTQTISLEDIGTGFIPFADLTESDTEGWTETAIGEDAVQTMKDGLDSVIDEEITPTTETKTIGE